MLQRCGTQCKLPNVQARPQLGAMRTACAEHVHLWSSRIGFIEGLWQEHKLVFFQIEYVSDAAHAIGRDILHAWTAQAGAAEMRHTVQASECTGKSSGSERFEQVARSMRIYGRSAFASSRACGKNRRSLSRRRTYIWSTRCSELWEQVAWSTKIYGRIALASSRAYGKNRTSLCRRRFTSGGAPERCVQFSRRVSTSILLVAGACVGC